MDPDVHGIIDMSEINRTVYTHFPTMYLFLLILMSNFTNLDYSRVLMSLYFCYLCRCLCSSSLHCMNTTNSASAAIPIAVVVCSMLQR